MSSFRKWTVFFINTPQFPVTAKVDPVYKWRLVEEFGPESFHVLPDGMLLFSDQIIGLYGSLGLPFWGMVSEGNFICGKNGLDSISGTNQYQQLMEKLSVGASNLIAGDTHILIDLSSWYK